MFTGIVEHAGAVRAVRAGEQATRLEVDLGPVAEGARTGDSIAVDGVCLTLVGPPEGGVGAFDVVPETLRLTTLGGLAADAVVNLEGALKVGDRLGGHFVQGHVDGTGTVRALDRDGDEVVLAIEAPAAVLRDLIRKGSVTVDGVALTVVDLDAEHFTVALVPHTLAVTSLRDRKPGDAVNLEADLMGKWVRRILAEQGAAEPSAGAVTRDLLEREGFA